MERGDRGAWKMSSGQSQTHDEVRSLLDELVNVKEMLREASRQLLRIERRVVAAFPGVAANSSRTGKGRSRQRSRLDERAARQVIADLKAAVAKGEQVEVKLRDYSVKPDLQLVAGILGMTNTKLPPKDELIRRISTRLRQSVSVTAGIHNVTGFAESDKENVP
jgi:hypothetical protein